MSESSAVAVSAAVSPTVKGYLAPRWHTLVLVGAVLLPVILRSPIALGTAVQRQPANLLPVYTRTIVIEWALFAFVWYGLRKNGQPLAAIMGRKWDSVSAAARDLAIGIGFLVGAVAVSSLLATFAKSTGPGGRNLLPHTAAEIAVWITLSATAGIVEEAVYRGYLQGQFQRLGLPVVLAVMAQALLFGIVHAYQGWFHAASIGCIGALAGVVTEWRRSVRPTMIGHALQDMLAAFHA